MDVKVVMTNDGGDIVKNKKDLAMVFGFENMPLLAMFGGCVEENTPTERLPNQIYNDWWGNNLLLPKNGNRQFNSDTERTLNTTALNSSGIILIEEAIKRDLKFLSEYAKIQVQVRLVNVDRIAIGIKIEQQKIVYLWDNLNRELVDAFAMVSSPDFSGGDTGIFDVFFDETFE